jgi:6-pyruvoyltetrahydropterin/6-carboxytetrahydropterin synthase
MSLIRITKVFTFEAAHALSGYDGPCRNIHGHSYELSVTIIGEPESDISSAKNGMVLDFGDLKRIVKKNIIDPFDHALVLGPGFQEEMKNLPPEACNNIRWVDYQPTSENMLIDFSKRISSLLPAQVKLHSLKLRETGTSFAEWYATDNLKKKEPLIN